MTSLLRLAMTFGLLLSLVTPALARSNATVGSSAAGALAALAALPGAHPSDQRGAERLVSERHDALPAWQASACHGRVDVAKGDEPASELFGVFGGCPALPSACHVLDASSSPGPRSLSSKTKHRSANARAPPAR